MIETPSELRSRTMSTVKRKDTSPELKLGPDAAG